MIQRQVGRQVDKQRNVYGFWDTLLLFYNSLGSNEYISRSLFIRLVACCCCCCSWCCYRSWRCCCCCSCSCSCCSCCSVTVVAVVVGLFIYFLSFVRSSFWLIEISFTSVKARTQIYILSILFSLCIILFCSLFYLYVLFFTLFREKQHKTAVFIF